METGWLLNSLYFYVWSDCRVWHAKYFEYSSTLLIKGWQAKKKRWKNLKSCFFLDDKKCYKAVWIAPIDNFYKVSHFGVKQLDPDTFYFISSNKKKQDYNKNYL